MGTRRFFLASLAGALLCAGWMLAPTAGAGAPSEATAAKPVPATQKPPAAQKPPAVPLPNREDSFKFAVLGDFGTGDRPQYQLGEQMADAAGQVPVRARDHGRRQHLRRRAAAGHEAEVRGPLQGPARRRRQVLCLARQSRRARAGPLRPLQHGRANLLHLQGAEGGRQVLRPRDRLSDPGADGVGREGDEERRREMEDSLLPSPALLVRQDPRLAPRAAPRSSSRSSSRPGSRSSSPATITSTNGSSRRRASPISSPVRAGSCGPGTSTRGRA